MRVRKPKKQGTQESKPKPKKRNGKTPAIASTSRKRYPSEELMPLEQYRANMSNAERNRWYKYAVIYMRAFISEGLSREEIKDRLGIGDDIYDAVETRLVEHDGAKYTSMGTAHRFYYFSLRMEQCIRELEDYVKLHMGDDPKKSGVVGAIKAKAQIHKDVMTMGQDLGIISKRAKEVRMLGEVNLNMMPTDELRELFEEQMQRFNHIVQGTPQLAEGYSQILENATRDAYAEADEIIDAEYSE